MMEGDVLGQAVGMRELLTVLTFVMVGMFTIIGVLARMLVTRLLEQFAQQFGEQSARLEKLEQRHQELDERLRRAASHEDIVRLHGRMDAVTSTLSELKGSITASTQVMAIVHEYLLNSKGGG
jgi:predicted PurR-regulated permease PerM